MRLVEDSLIAVRERERERETLKKLNFKIPQLTFNKHKKTHQRTRRNHYA